MTPTSSGEEFKSRWRSGSKFAGFAVSAALVILAARWATSIAARVPSALPPEGEQAEYLQFLDRDGAPLSVTYRNHWNVQNQLGLSQLPPLLTDAVIAAEDKRYYHHWGIDPLASVHALFQNIAALRIVRGGSTITEQVAKLLNPKPRSLRGRIESAIQALVLEQRFSKNELLTFYLNQAPFGGRRRGVGTAARDIFDRDLSTLSRRELLTLAVLIRAPEALLNGSQKGLDVRVAALTQALVRDGKLSQADAALLLQEPVERGVPRLPVEASQFVAAARQYLLPTRTYAQGKVTTTLDSGLQRKAQLLLRDRLQRLRDQNATAGAVLVVDNETGEVLVWATEVPAQTGTNHIDGVLIRRQAGSTLKPFLYTLALEKGWTAATQIEDSPYVRAVGVGAKFFRNYSNRWHGKISLREALGNSLNLPALRAIDFVGVDNFRTKLAELGFANADAPSDYFGEGLALGSIEVSLFELVRAYRVLARGGTVSPVVLVRQGVPGESPEESVLKPEEVSIITHILSDPTARAREFGERSMLSFPFNTAAKTGTSSDYRDAWAVAFTSAVTVGAWFGNFSYEPMQEVSGSRGPLLLVRAMLSELARVKPSSRMQVHPRLQKRSICTDSGLPADDHCPSRDEWFVPGTEPEFLHAKAEERRSDKIVIPTPGLRIGRDPRIPDSLERVQFAVDVSGSFDRLEWMVDGAVTGTSRPGDTRWPWQPIQGEHVLSVKVWRKDQASVLGPVRFFVR